MIASSDFRKPSSRCPLCSVTQKCSRFEESPFHYREWQQMAADGSFWERLQCHLASRGAISTEFLIADRVSPRRISLKSEQ